MEGATGATGSFLLYLGRSEGFDDVQAGTTGEPRTGLGLILRQCDFLVLLVITAAVLALDDCQNDIDFY